MADLPDAAARHPRHRALCRRRGEGVRRRARHPPRLERKRARAEPARRSRPIAPRPARSIAIPTARSTGCARRSARRYGLDPERIVCGTGSDELIGLLARAYVGPGDEVLYSRHGFLDVSDRRAGRRRHAGRGAREEPHRRCRCASSRASRRRPGSSSSPIPTIPTGTYPVARRGDAAACRRCRPRCCW